MKGRVERKEQARNKYPTLARRPMTSLAPYLEVRGRGEAAVGTAETRRVREVDEALSTSGVML